MTGSDDITFSIRKLADRTNKVWKSPGFQNIYNAILYEVENLRLRLHGGCETSNGVCTTDAEYDLQSFSSVPIVSSEDGLASQHICILSSNA